MRLLNNYLLSAIISACPLSLYCTERQFVQDMIQRIAIPDAVSVRLLSMADDTPKGSLLTASDENLALYRAYPGLKKKLLRLNLSDLPTPVARLEALEKKLNIQAEGQQVVSATQIYIKRDDLTGRIHNGVRSFGGNKIRKLEFILADALNNGARSILTYGCAGSNHVVATASCCKQLDLRCLALLTPQAQAEVVKRNLLLMHQYGAHMVLNPDGVLRTVQTPCSCIQHKYMYGDFPYFIPIGGSTALGTIGYVNAAFELKEHIARGDIPEPDYIYVATGSFGTAAGLLLGLCVAGLKTILVPVAVQRGTGDAMSNAIVQLAMQANRLLHDLDEQFPLCESLSLAGVRTDCVGTGYGHSFDQAQEALKLFQEDGVMLDTTYTSKAAAALVADAKAGLLGGKTVLFWNTFCADVQLNSSDHRILDKQFHHYFGD